MKCFQRSLCIRREKRRDFASQVEEEKQQEELSREDVLRLNKIHTRYQQAEIEDFIESNMQDDHMEVKDIDIRDEESFEKLILPTITVREETVI